MFNDSFLTGVEEIDRQHQNLINLTSEARVTLARNPTLETVKQVIRELLSYAIYHFRTEETLMAQYGYAQETSDAQAHIDEHRQFSARIVAAQDALRGSSDIDTDKLLDFLCTWITQHIMNTDKKLAEFIKRKRCQLPPGIAANS